MKKILSVLLCICMVLTLIPATVMASGTDSNKYVIASTDPAVVQAEFGDAAEVTKDGETIVIKLLKDLDRNLHIGNSETFWEINVVLDLNGKTIAPVNSDRYTYTLFFDDSFDSFESTFIITGSGTLKGVDNGEGAGYISSEGLPGVRFKLADGCEYFTLKLDGNNYLGSEQNTGEHECPYNNIFGSELVMTQVGGNGDDGDREDNTELEYYLVGMINNSDHYEKEYKFIDGKIEFKFTSDSYVAVMDSEGNIYLTDGWLDFDPTEATLKRSGDNKMHISPKSDNRTLWLTVNDDGTLTLTTYEPIKTYTVTFDANGHGEAPDAIEAVNDGNKITAPAAPTAEGYTFGGWYKEATCENAWDFDNDTVTADTTLYALWTPVIVDSTPADLPDTVNEKGPSKIWINNIKLENGDYLATNEATEASENYTNGTPYVAVYKNGILYLNNINIENNPNGESSSDEDHAIYWKAANNDDLIIELIEGTTNNISDGKWSAINGADGGGFYCPSLTIQGNGTLNVSCADNAIWVWDGTTIQNGATVNITCGGTGISNNDRSGKIVVKSGTTLNISGDDHAIQTDNNRTGTFYVEGGDITLKGNTSAIYHINCDFGNIPVYVSENVSGEGATLWDGTTDITTYKYVSLSGTRTEVTPTYTVTFDANGGTVGSSTATTEADGKLANLPTPSREGSYTFNGWYTEATDGTQITTDTIFTADTTIYAQWTYTGSTGGGSGISYYAVSFKTNGGSEISTQKKGKNALVTKPADPTKEGYVFAGWYTDKELTKAYDFSTIITKNIVLYAKWEIAEEENKVTESTHNCPSLKFGDLDITKWYHEDIDYVLENNIMVGTSTTEFAPDANLTRGMLVTILYRSEGEPATNRSIPFADVDMGAYYANAVVWAQQNGIVKGISETEYAPDMNVTREQLATIMFRYAQFKGMDAVTAEENLGFNDAYDISDWAVAAMNWGVGRDYIFGRTEGVIAPKVAATRAEIAAFIHRYIVNNEK